MKDASRGQLSYITRSSQSSKPSTEIGRAPSPIADNDVHYLTHTHKTLPQLTVSSTIYPL